MNRDTQGRFTAAREAINDERMTRTFKEMFGFEADNLTWPKIGASFVVAIIWGYALGCAAGVVIDAVFLLTMPVVAQYIVAFAILFAALWLSFVTSYYVSSYTVNGTCAAAKYIAQQAGVFGRFVKAKHAEAKAAYADAQSMREVVSIFKHRNFEAA